MSAKTPSTKTPTPTPTPAPAPKADALPDDALDTVAGGVSGRTANPIGADATRVPQHQQRARLIRRAAPPAAGPTS